MVSYQELEKLLGFSTTLPVVEKWSAAADFLKIISDYCLQNKPETIVECSSGTSSLVLSQCCQINQYGHVYSLENGEEFVTRTQDYLATHLFEKYCNIIHAPLKGYHLGSEQYQWYDLKNLPDIKIDMLVVDGPPGFLQDKSRYPALPLLHDLMSENCTVFLDDAAREDEQEIVSTWLREYPEFQSEYVGNERGCAILTR